MPSHHPLPIRQHRHQIWRRQAIEACDGDQLTIDDAGGCQVKAQQIQIQGIMLGVPDFHVAFVRGDDFVVKALGVTATVNQNLLLIEEKQ